MHKATILWFPQGNKEVKVLSVKKSYILFFMALMLSFLFISLASVLFTLHFNKKLSKKLEQNKILSQELKKQKKLHKNLLTRKNQKLEKLEQLIPLQKETIAHLKKKLNKSKEQLQEIRDMELKVRGYLGLDTKFSKGNQTHQGSISPVQEFEDLQSSNLEEEHLQFDSKVPEVISYSLSLKESLSQVLTHLQQREKQLHGIPSILPVKGENIWLSCDFGWRKNPFTDRKEFHKGIDIAGKLKTPIISPADGTVVKVYKNNLSGKLLRIKHTSGIITAYGHLHSFKVKKGQQVTRGEVVALMGNTGRSTGTHLHYEVIKDKKNKNPINFVLDRNHRTLTLKD